MRHIRAFAIALALSVSAAAADPADWANEWPRTDFSRSAVSFDEIVSGGPPRDGIPAINEPAMRPARGESRLDAREPVLSYDPPDAAARAYPVRYLMWHEIVNDVAGGRPIAVTYCPLCNSGMVFDARIEGERRRFGVTGKLRFSDMVMFDRTTESWWQQAIGEGIVGTYTGRRLKALPARMQSWSSFREAHPDGLVMDQPEWRRAYGTNPYVGYDRAPRPFLFSGEMPPHGIAPLTRVVRVGERAWPLPRLRAAGELREAGLVLRWEPGQASPLDTRDVAAGREIGNVLVRDGNGHDVPHDLPFAFSFHALFPNGTWMTGESAGE